MKKIIIAYVVISLTTFLIAEASGEYGFQMLKILSSANAAAKAGNDPFSSSDAFSFLQNPAAGLINRTHAVSITQNYWIFDTKMSSVAYLNSHGKTSFGIAFRQLDYGKFPDIDEQGDLIGEFHPLDLNMITNFAFRINPNHYAGLNLHGLYEKIKTASSFAISCDLGYTYLTPIKDLKLAAAIKHLGSSTKMDEDNIDLPTTFEIGLTKSLETDFIEISSEIKGLKHQDRSELNAVVSLSFLLYERFRLSGGYKFNYDSEALSTGLGFIYKNLLIDYAFIPFKYEINDVHMFSISYLF